MSRVPGYRYRPWHDGPDPLAPPYDLRRAVDAMGGDVLEGSGVDAALRAMLRRGTDDVRGLDDYLHTVRARRREVRDRGRLDGTLEEVRRLLDQAVDQERAALAGDPSEEARLRETALDDLPPGTAQAVRRLASYTWTSAEAGRTFQRLRDLLRQDLLDTRFRGMKEALQSADPAVTGRITEMLADLNALLDADARGEDTREGFADFMRRHGDLIPGGPKSLADLVDLLARRSAAAERFLRSLRPAQRGELSALMAAALEDLDLATELDGLTARLRARRPDLGWTGREEMTGLTPLAAGDATSALEELADLDALEESLRQDYPGAALEDVDDEAVSRALGRQAVDDLARLRRLERALEEQHYLARGPDGLALTPKAVRRLGETALRRAFAGLREGLRGDHDVRNAGAGGEPTGTGRAWRFGDEQPLDAVRTVGNAVLRTGPGPLRLAVEDFEIVETERRVTTAVCLLVDLSYSMVLRGAWGPAKSTALALHTLMTGRYPHDALQVVGFSRHARVLSPTDLAGLDSDMVQGTNLQHALVVAGRFLDRHPEAQPVVLVVTDGEPTAHLLRDGRAFFDWPPSAETVALTLAEVDKMTRRGAVVNVFQLDDDPRLTGFVEEVARRNGGQVLLPSPERLGEYVVRDYLRTRRRRH